MITNTRQILHTAATHEHNRVLLEVMTFIRNVGNHFRAVRETYLCDLSNSRIGLLWRAGHDLHTDTAAEGVTLQRRSLGLRLDLATALSHELVDGWHVVGWKVLKSRKERGTYRRQELPQALFRALIKNTISRWENHPKTAASWCLNSLAAAA